MNPVFRKSGDVRHAAALNRTILEQIVPSAPFQALRSRTALEEDKAAIAAVVMSEHALEMMKSEQLINRGEMLDLWDLARQEQDLEARAEAMKAVNEMQESKDDEIENESARGHEKENKDRAMKTKKELAEMADAAERAAKVSEARLNQKSRQFETQLRGADQSALKRMQLKTAELAREIDQAADDSHDFSREFGQGGRVAAGARLELGRRLARNKKLGELARMVGRFKQDARALKRKTLERGVAEAYDIELGSELGRLIPAELLAMHHPILKRDFHRRVLEGAVLQYRLRDDEPKGKGPMVVCIDVSSSMQGDKEMWAKAVALTLMDIARRQRRLFRAVMFSSGDVSLRVLDLNRERRYQPDLNKVVEMAEYFPGGGTDFEAPIDAAVELLGEKKLKRGDIVIITDGESQVSPDWLARLRERKQELDFSIFAVLVDVGSAEMSSLAQFADRITSVKRISDEHARDIFVQMQS
jgi:uncharacterized protein with von Willebrand factor type A (vWA) domain